MPTPEPVPPAYHYVFEDKTNRWETRLDSNWTIPYDIDDWLAGTNLEKLIARGKAWTLPMSDWASLPNLLRLFRQTVNPMKTNEWKREQLEHQFWTMPKFRFEIACLIYHFHCGETGDPTGPAQRFREWLKHSLERILHPDDLEGLYRSLSSVRCFTDIELGLPFTALMEKQLVGLLWLSLPKKDEFGALQLQRLKDRGPEHSFSRYKGLMAYYESFWVSLE